MYGSSGSAPLGGSGAGSVGKQKDGPVAQPESNLGSVGMVGFGPWNFNGVRKQRGARLDPHSRFEVRGPDPPQIENDLKDAISLLRAVDCLRDLEHIGICALVVGAVPGAVTTHDQALHCSFLPSSRRFAISIKVTEARLFVVTDSAS